MWEKLGCLARRVRPAGEQQGPPANMADVVHRLEQEREAVPWAPLSAEEGAVAAAQPALFWNHTMVLGLPDGGLTKIRHLHVRAAPAGSRCPPGVRPH